MLQQTSIDNNAVNKIVGQVDELRKIVLNIFSIHAGTSMSTNEMIRYYFTHFDNLPADTAQEKTQINSVEQALKGARTALTNEGILKHVNKRVCYVSGREVNVYEYVGIPLTELEQKQNELKRRENDLNRVTKKIAELKQEIAELEKASNKGNQLCTQVD